MAEVMEFPQPEYALICQFCGGYAFRIMLNSPDNTDYKGYECLNIECEAVFSFNDVECELDDD